jgi:hypothetical protein
MDTIDHYGGLLRSTTLTDATTQMVNQGANSALYMLAFVRASRLEYESRITRHELVRALNGEHPTTAPLVLPGKTLNGENNHTFLLRNTYRNYLRLIGVLPSIEYDELHSRGVYRFTNTQEPTNFFHTMNAYREKRQDKGLFLNKRVLSLGPGRARDEQAMITQGGASSIEMIEGSPFMLGKMPSIQKELPEHLQSHFHIPLQPMNMLIGVKAYADIGERFDTVYCHSTLHYFDDTVLNGLLRDIQHCLQAKGRLVLAVKAPGAVLDGNGIPILEEQSWDGSSTAQRMWLNFDGQMRSFRSKETWMQLLGKYFHIEQVTQYSVEHYETDIQRPQLFYYFVCRNKGRS